MTPPLPRVLTVAGSDSGGGAGIEADLKTFAALGGYGMAAVTAVTAQNTRGVYAVHNLPPDIVAAQIDAVAADIGVDAAKTGMLSTAAIVEAVAEAIRRHGLPNLVVDPVMIAKSGDALLEASARDALIAHLLPLAALVTPNLPEAEVLAGIRIEDDGALYQAGERIHALGPAAVLIKGGHRAGSEATDWLYDGADWLPFSAPRIDTPNTHGTGCTFSAAIATGLAHGRPLIDAVQDAKAYLTGALQHSLPLGHGHGPLHHGWQTPRPNAP